MHQDSFPTGTVHLFCFYFARPFEVFFRRIKYLVLCAHQDSNLGPHEYQSSALAN